MSKIIDKWFREELAYTSTSIFLSSVVGKSNEGHIDCKYGKFAVISTEQYLPDITFML